MTNDNEKFKQDSQMMMSAFSELARMITLIDRFDTEIPTDEKKAAIEAIEKSEELTEQILEENL